MKLINKELLDNLSEQARENVRLRKNYNIHNTLDDSVQQLLNALEPGSILPIHRHLHTEETYLLVRGGLRVLFYNNEKEVVKTILLNLQDGNYGVSIPKGQWHTIDNIEKGTIIYEVKQGPYAPLNESDILVI